MFTGMETWCQVTENNYFDALDNNSYDFAEGYKYY